MRRLTEHGPISNSWTDFKGPVNVQVQTNGSKTPQRAVQTAIGSLEAELHDIRDKFQVIFVAAHH